MSFKNLFLKQLDEKCEEETKQGVTDLMRDVVIKEEINKCQIMGANRDEITAILLKYKN